MTWIHRLFQKNPVVTAPADDWADLKSAADGLLYPSETDAPFEPFQWPATAGATAREVVASHAGGETVEAQLLEDFFADLADTEEAVKFANLKALLLKQLAATQVFRVGQVKIVIYIIGQTRSGWAGLRTESVET